MERDRAEPLPCKMATLAPGARWPGRFNKEAPQQEGLGLRVWGFVSSVSFGIVWAREYGGIGPLRGPCCTPSAGRPAARETTPSAPDLASVPLFIYSRSLSNHCGTVPDVHTRQFEKLLDVSLQMLSSNPCQSGCLSNSFLRRGTPSVSGITGKNGSSRSGIT